MTKKPTLVTKDMLFKYAPKGLTSKKGRPRKIYPDNWITGPDLLTHDMYYAWQKHRAQATFRGELHDLTWPEWQAIWQQHDFRRRGRKPEDLTLTRDDPEGAWTWDNCLVITRLEQLQRAMAYRQLKKHD